MKTKLNKIKAPSFALFLTLFLTANLYAQPVNDDCSNAFTVTVSSDEASCVLVDGSTVDGTPSSEPADVCSSTWFGDDIWFSFTTGSTLPDVGITIKAFFGTESGDLMSVGMALYGGCGIDESPFACFSNEDPAFNSLTIYNCDLVPNHTYYVRLWSTPGINENSGNVRLCAFETIAPTDNVLWGNNSGEGDFNGGLNNWTTVNDNDCPGFDLWRWSSDGTANDGAFAVGTGISQAPTACNGAMSFDSDFYDNNGDANNLGGGDCPAVQIGELISPSIDLSTIAAGVAGVTLKFHQATRQFNSVYIVSYSNDNGVNWTDVTVNNELETNGTAVNEWKRIFLSNADLNSSTFKIKFRYEANYYFWIVDDVQLIETEANNLRVLSNFFAIAPNAVTPISQVEPFSHIADVYNAGAVEQTNVNLNVTIVDDGTSNVVFSDDNPYGSIPPNVLVANQPFSNYFTPDGTTPTSYTATYEVTSDSVDFDPSDNTQTYSFSTSDTTFAKEFGATTTILPAAANWDFNEPHSWTYGNYYYIVDGDNWDASSATFSIGNANDPNLVGRLIVIYLYRWEDDTNENGDMDPEERTKVGFYVYEIEGTELNTNLITVPFYNFPTADPGPIDLQSNQAYALMIEYSTNDQVDFAMMAGQVDYDGMTYRSELDGIPNGAGRYGALLEINGDIESEPFSSIGFNTPLAPVVRLNISLQQITVAGNVDDVSCFGECSGSIDLTVTGGPPNYTYAWSGPNGYMETTEDISGLCPGNYQVIVTSGNSNTETASFTVAEPSLISIDPGFTDASCFQICDGSVDLTVSGGAPPYGYDWSDGSIFEDPVDLCAGNYDVTITDNNGCTFVSNTITINEPPEMVLDFEYTVLPCAFPCQNSINLTVTNGNSPFNFQWFDNFGTPISSEEDIVNVCPGLYTVIVTDINGCIIEGFPEITDPSFPIASTNILDALCFESCDGTIDLEIDGGVLPYTYEWSDGLPPTEDQINLCAATYTVTITDSLGCSNVVSIDVDEPTEFLAIVETSNPSCFDECDGTATITISGGTPPYPNPGPTEDLCAGSYSYVVTDANGCTIMLDFEIAETPELVITIDSLWNETDTMMNGFIMITPGGGTPPFTFVWSDGSGTVSTDQNPTGLSAGTYSVGMTDANGCTFEVNDLVIDNIVAISRIQLSNAINIFPNPTSGILHVNFDLKEPGSLLLKIYDITGRLIETQQKPDIYNQSLLLDLSRFENGIYTIKIMVDDAFMVEKIVKHQW